MTGTLRLGIFGGAFDPPHLGHCALAQAALQALGLNQLHLVPTGHAWHKSRPLSAPEHRLAMVKLAFANLPGVQVDPREIQRAGPSYTADTLREFHAQWPDAQLFLIVGEDQACALPTWHDWQTVLRLAVVAVARRADQAHEAPRFTPPAAFAARFRWLNMPSMPISATRIRAAVSSHQALSALVPESVAHYMDHHHLYQTATP